MKMSKHSIESLDRFLNQAIELNKLSFSKILIDDPQNELSLINANIAGTLTTMKYFLDVIKQENEGKNNE